MENIPLLGADGRRPVINENGISHCLEMQIQEVLNEGHFPPLSNYTIVSVINRGPTGYVMKAEDENGDEFALKRVQCNPNERFPYTFMEISILRSLKHENIIALEGIVTDRGLDRNFMCMEYCPENLTELLKDLSSLNQVEVKCLMMMLVSGVAYMHSQHVLHRNLSSSHVLMCPSGMLKIAGFGKAVIWRKGQKLLCDVGNPGYRAPELILKCQYYDYSVDMWSVGCIFGQLLLHKPIFPADDDNNVKQMNDIIRLCGSLTDELIPNYSSHSLVRLNLLISQTQSNFQRLLNVPGVSNAAIDFLKEFFVYDPSKRIKADVVQSHRYFSIEPLPCPPEELMLCLDKKRKRRAIVNYSVSEIEEVELEEGEVTSEWFHDDSPDVLQAICKISPKLRSNEKARRICKK